MLKGHDFATTDVYVDQFQGSLQRYPLTRRVDRHMTIVDIVPQVGREIRADRHLTLQNEGMRLELTDVLHFVPPAIMILFCSHRKVDGVEIAALDEGELADWRARNIGFIFQFYNLMPVLTALENVELPLLLTRLGAQDRRDRAQAALALVGLADRVDHYPSELSGGQQQRVAIARAIITDPTLLVADEPTGDLDRKSAEDVLALLDRLNQELGKTIVMVTHDANAASRARRIVHLEKGELHADASPASPAAR